MGGEDALGVHEERGNGTCQWIGCGGVEAERIMEAPIVFIQVN